MKVANLLLYYYYLAQTTATSATEVFAVTDADGIATVIPATEGSAEFAVTDADGVAGETAATTGDAVFGVTDADGISVILTDIGIAPPQYAYGPRYVKPPRIRKIFWTRTSGGIEVGGAAKVVIRKRQKPLPKVVVPPEANYLFIRAEGGTSLSAQSDVRTHRHQTVVFRAKTADVSLSVATEIAIRLHVEHVVQARATSEIDVQASTDFHAHSILDPGQTAASIEIGGHASIDLQPHLELDALASFDSEAAGAATVQILPRTPNVFSYLGQCNLVASGTAEAFGIEDRLTDEELLFLLEAA